MANDKSNLPEEDNGYSKKLDLIIERNKNKASALQKIIGAIDKEKNKNESSQK